MNGPDALWLGLLAVVVITSLLVTVQSRARPNGDPRLARIERKLDAIMAQLGIPYTDQTDDPVRALVRAGDKIRAIKAYRDAHGVGLREGKEAVEAMQVEEGMR